MFRFCILFLISVSILACKNEQATEPVVYSQIEGQTMGTYFRITYADSKKRNLRVEIEDLLEEINLEVSTYIDSSIISHFNRSALGLDLGFDAVSSQAGGRYPHFRTNFVAAKEVYKVTQGAFDPTVMPLVNYWGFGYTEKKKITAVDSVLIDSLIQLVGFDKILVEGELLRKTNPDIQLDFSALAKGYAVDEVGRLLYEKGIQNYLVDIGGEVRGRGVNTKGQAWKIGINVPLEEALLSQTQAVMPLNNQSIATSGNYRNFYEVDGVKYSHTINPQTGFPERNPLLSASVLTDNCMIADAYATAFMVMGVDAAYELASRQPEIEAYFIYSDTDGKMAVKYTSGLEEIFGER